MYPTISIIVPYYKQSHTLPRLFDSIIKQPYDSLEVILVDDHSEDCVDEIVKQWINKGLKINLITEPSRVYTLQCRLDGIKHAQGQVIGFADADDVLWGTESLRKNINIFLKSNTDILHFSSVIINNAGEFIKYAAPADPFAKLLESKQQIFEYFCKADLYGCSSLWNKLFSKKICQNVLSCYTEHFRLRCEDGWLLINLLLQSQKYIGSDEIGYGYCWRERRQTINPERTIAHFQAYKYIPKLLLDHGIKAEYVNLLKSSIKNLFCKTAGHMCAACLKLSHDELTNHVQSLTKGSSYSDILTALLIANGMNAERLLYISDFQHH